LTDYRGSPQEFISAAKYGYLYQGQPYSWQEAPRGYPSLGFGPDRFVAFLENHDQISNFALGHRVRTLTSPGEYRAMTALLLLGPWTPLLFQGEEFGATTPFCYFAEVGDDELKDAVRKGRFEFLAQFPSAGSPESKTSLPVPHAVETFERCKLDWAEAEKNLGLVRLHRDLIRLRREDPRFSRQVSAGVDGAVLGSECFVVRYFGEARDNRLLIVNLGCRAKISPPSEPLLAPPVNWEWEMLWTSDSSQYDGPGWVEIVPDDEWILPAQATVVFRPRRRTQPRKKPTRR
jgi:maltooligosyltrehalose trehalohydrolase